MESREPPGVLRVMTTAEYPPDWATASASANASACAAEIAPEMGKTRTFDWTPAV